MTTKETKRLFELVSKMNENNAGAPTASADKRKGQESNGSRGLSQMAARPAPQEPAHGEKGDFIKMTITLSPDVYDLFNEEVARRKRSREKGATISAIIRELAGKHLSRGS